MMMIFIIILLHLRDTNGWILYTFFKLLSILFSYPFLLHIFFLKPPL